MNRRFTLTRGDKKVLASGMLLASPILAFWSLLPIFALGLSPFWSLAVGPGLLLFILGSIWVGNSLVSSEDDRHWRSRP